MLSRILRHPLSPVTRRGLYSLLAVIIVMTAGTVGMVLLAGWSWIEAFYFMAMIATAEGPPTAPPNFWSTIFAAIMAFVSIGTLITAIGVIFGPFLGFAFHRGMIFAQKEFEKEEEKRKKGMLNSLQDSKKERETASSN